MKYSALYSILLRKTMHIVLFFGVFIMNMYVFSLVDAETLTGTTSTGVIVTVDNVVLPPSANLILNPSFELGTSFPTNWSQGGYGTNTRIFTYPATGIVGSKSVKVDMTSYTDGDAKWYFDDVNVTAGIEYTYSQKYISTIPSHIFARYKSNGGAYSYVLLQSLPVASTPTQVGVAFTPPAGTTSLTLWNAISQVGSLTLDDVSLTFNTSGSGGTGTTDTVAPTVNVDSPVSGSTVSETISITATAIDDTGVVGVQFKIDGTNIGTEDTSSPYSTSFETTLLSNGTHTITATARDAAGNTFTSTGVIVTVDNVVLPPSANLILNPSVETSINAGTRPASWFKGRYGNNDTTFVYPVSGIDGNKAININITRHVDGNAKWYFADVAVSTGVTYRYTQDYISTVPTEIEARYRDASGDYTYALLKSLIAKPSGGSVDIVITPPIGTVSMTLWNSIAQVGSLTTDNYSITPIELPSFSEGMVTFSFDDGFQSIYDKAIPILDAAGIKSTQAIITNALDDTPLYMTSQQVLELFLNGHEIASHTKSHASLISLSAPDAISEIVDSKNTLANIGVTTVDTLVFPYGLTNELVDSFTRNAGYTGARGNVPGFNTPATDKYNLYDQPVESIVTFDTVKSWIDTAISRKHWLILELHQQEASGGLYSNNPALISDIVNYIQLNNVKTVTVGEGIKLLNN